ncbi:MAG: TolC family protein [Elusimicrobiota bacterium]|nr:TolC family protein [Elusimicrobiota bacterium]
MRALLALLLCAPAAAASPFEEFLAGVSARHPELKALGAARDAADAALLERRGAFDPTLSARFSERAFNSSSAPGTRYEAKEGEASLDFLTRWGAKASVGGRAARGDLKTPVSPTGRDGTLSYSIGVPLLRGALSNPRQAAERKAEIGLTAAQARWEERRLRLLGAAADSWWKWAAARRKLDIERELLANARFRQEAVSARARAGDLPAVAAVEAEQELWLRRGRLARAERALQQAALSLSAYLWTEEGAPAPVPSADGTPDAEEPSRVGEEEAQRAETEALAARPELRALAFAREAARVDESLARNSILPQLDALWSQGEDRGVGGVGPVRRVGVELSVPLFFRAGRGAARQARLGIEGLDWAERSLRLRVVNEVRDAVSAVNADAERLDAARKEAELAERLEKAERAAYELGDSTLFLVNQRERAAAEAKARAVEVLAEYRTSRAALAAARAAL